MTKKQFIKDIFKNATNIYYMYWLQNSQLYHKCLKKSNTDGNNVQNKQKALHKAISFNNAYIECYMLSFRFCQQNYTIVSN